MEIAMIYLRGLGVIVAVVGHVIAFHWIWKKLFNDVGCSNNFLCYIALPFAMPMAITLIFAVPYLIGMNLA